MSLQLEQVNTTATPVQLGFLPGSSSIDSLIDPLYHQIIALRQAVAEERWPSVVELSTHCLGLGYGAFRVLRSEAITARESVRSLEATRESTTALLLRLASDPQGDDLFAKMRERMAASRPNLVPTFDGLLQLLKQGETRDLPWLQALSRREVGVRSTRAKAGQAAIASLSRGLLGLTHANFNLAYQKGQPETKLHGSDDAIETFRAAVDEFRAALRSGQLALYGALTANQHEEDVSQAACALAGSIEERLPRFARAQAWAYRTMDSLRSKGRGGAAEKLGHLAMVAGAATREALASHVAGYNLALQLRGPIPAPDAIDLYRKAASLAFDATLPHGKDIPIATLSEVEDSDFVEIEGFVTALPVSKSSDQKLISRVELLDPSSGVSASAAILFTHLPHVGLTAGAFCGLSGTYRESSSLCEGRPAVEIDRLSVAQISKQSWWAAFLWSAKPWFQYWRNENNMRWSLGPHHHTPADAQATQLGAGELIFPPFVRI
jgi:hypothetical protein